MKIQIEMPQLSSEGEGATLATWLVSVGDQVEQGDVIAELETDKSTVELEAPATGVMVECAVQEGTEGITPGAILGTLEVDETSVLLQPADAPPETSTEAPARPARMASSTGPIESAESPEGNTSSRDDDLRAATPLARRAAAAREVDLSAISGSGPGGRVVEADVLRSSESTAASAADSTNKSAARSAPQAVVSSTPGAPEIEITGSHQVQRLSAMRKTIARRMTESKQQVPHFYLRMRCPMDAVVEIRANLNHDLAANGRDLKISVNDFVLRAVGLALRDVPEANVSFAGNEMILYDGVDVAVAVATEGGLVTPVVRDVDRKGLSALALEVRELAGLARAGQLRPDQYQGGSFTISNLGMYGVETVYPIINPPQACILGVGAAEEQPVVRDGEIVIGMIAAMTLAADHRAVDGAVGARLLAAICDRLKDPLGMLL